MKVGVKTGHRKKKTTQILAKDVSEDEMKRPGGNFAPPPPQKKKRPGAVQ